jgi:hypothetical protein
MAKLGRGDKKKRPGVEEGKAYSLPMHMEADDYNLFSTYSSITKIPMTSLARRGMRLYIYLKEQKYTNIQAALLAVDEIERNS